jgi:hypothetical protein
MPEKFVKLKKLKTKNQKPHFWRRFSPNGGKKWRLKPHKHTEINASASFWPWVHCKSLYIKGFVAPKKRPFSQKNHWYFFPLFSMTMDRVGQFEALKTLFGHF